MKNLIFLVMFLSGIPLFAQKLLLDDPIKAGDLTLFRDLNEVNNYYYLTNQPRLVEENGKPVFSFLKYLNAGAGVPTSESSIENGGGIITAQVTLEVEKNVIEDARRALRRINSEAIIKGPIIFRKGTFSIVSITNNAQGEKVGKVCGLGAAPLIQGSKASISILLSRDEANLLWKQFQTNNPDIAFSFEMEFDGFRKPRNARIEANFEQIYKHKTFSSGVAGQLFAAEINNAYDDMIRSGGIKIYQEEGDELSNEMIAIAYNKLIEMMFDPVGNSGQNQLVNLERRERGALAIASSMYQKAHIDTRRENQRIRTENRLKAERGLKEEANKGKETNTNNQPTLPAYFERTAFSEIEYEPDAWDYAIEDYFEPEEEEPMPYLAVVGMYQFKQIRQTGKFEINLNKAHTSKIVERFDGRIGQIDCKECFSRVNIWDDMFEKRDVSFMVDNMNQDEFKKFINFVSVTLKKEYPDGNYENIDFTINTPKFATYNNNFIFSYPWDGEEAKDDFLNYQYRVIWNFHGSKKVTEDWKETSEPAIALSPPIERRKIILDANPENITTENIRSITVNIYYDYGTGEKRIQKNFSGDSWSEEVDFMLPKGKYDYEYDLSWLLWDDNTKESNRRIKSDKIQLPIDIMPK